MFNIRQQKCDCVTDKLKCHNLYSKYPPFSSTQVWICMSHPQHSVAVTLACISDDLTSGL